MEGRTGMQSPGASPEEGSVPSWLLQDRIPELKEHLGTVPAHRGGSGRRRWPFPARTRGRDQ